MPICHVLMTNKRFLSYQKISKDIKLMVESRTQQGGRKAGL